MTTTTIIIPARYGSTRFPGKPLAKIAGKTMLQRVVEVARTAGKMDERISYLVATDDERIAMHCNDIKAPFIMTPESCKTGSDRVLAALRQLSDWPDFVINLQGDAPFTEADVIMAMVYAFRDNPRLEVVTPVHRLSWEDLDALREAKKATPFSGTTAILDERKQALWFSKNIIPAIRKEEDLRQREEFSPVWQHMGLYGFRVDVLEKFCSLEPGHYEELEGLEQLRMLENGIKVQAVPVEVESGITHSGIDSPEDLKRAEKILKGKKGGLFG